MRIAYVSYELPPETVGGIGMYVSHASRMLAARGHEVTIFAGSRDGSRREEQHGAARVLRMPCREHRDFHAVAVPAVASAHAQRPFDVIEVPDLYAEGRGLRQAAPDAAMVMRAHTPSFIAHEVDFHALGPTGRRLWAARRMMGGLARGATWGEAARSARARVHFRESFDWAGDAEREVALQAELVSPPSERLARRLHEDWRIPRDKLRVVPYPHLPSPRLLQLEVPVAGRTVAFHGGVRYFKGIHVLVEAMQEVVRSHPDARLVIAGASGPSPVPRRTPAAWWSDRMVEWRDTLEWLQPRLAALGDRVTVRGFVPPDRLHEHLAAADICVFPSLFDNFPNACLEAMTAARPIVATRSGGMEEMIGDDGGLLVEPGRAGELAAAIRRLMDDAALRAAIAKRARERVTTRYAAAVVAPLHEALYEEAVALRREAAP